MCKKQFDWQRLGSAFFFAACLAWPGWAEGLAEEATTEAGGGKSEQRFHDEVTVTATREERATEDVPAAIGVVASEDLDRGRREGLDDYLQMVPGVHAGANDGGSDVKIAIRGFGARSTFGVRDILVMVDGVSITDADGFTRLDQVDLASAERVEVLKGPASAIYGNAAFGGVVNVITEHGEIGNPVRRLRLEGGELESSKGLVSIAGGSDRSRLAYALHLSSFRLDGFRDHNETRTRRLSGTADHFLSDRTTLRWLLNMSQHRDEIPGTLDAEQLASDPEQVRSLFVDRDYRRDDDRYRLGAVIESTLSSRSYAEGRLFYLTRNLDHPIFQVIDQEGDRLMGGARYRLDLGKGDHRHRLAVGVDLDREDIDSRRFLNLGGEPGALTLSADQLVESFAVYAQDEIVLGEHWSAVLGARYDNITYDTNDRLLSDGDQSARRTFQRVSPKIGLLWNPGADFGLFLNLSSAFQTPTRSELSATVDANGFNPELDPQLARHAEIGLRGTQRRLRYELSLFQTDVDDEILPKEQINFRTIFGNVGETRHRGIESSLQVILLPELRLEASYSWSDNEFIDFGDFTGNRIPGFPEHQGRLALVTTRSEGLNGSLSWQRTGSIFLNDSNQDVQSPYSVVDLHLRYGWGKWSFFVQGNNLTDELYSSWLSVNERSGFFFAPAKPRNFSVGFDLRF